MNLYYELFEKKNHKSTIKLTKTDKIIHNYIIKNIDLIQDLSINQIANNTYTSRASIDRYVNKFGVKGYKEFKSNIIHYKLLDQHQNDYSLNISLDLSYSQEKLCKLAQKLIDIKDKNILISGLGGSFISAEYLSRRLNFLGFKTSAQSISSILGMDLNIDKIFLISNSGNTKLLSSLLNDYPNIESFAITQKNSDLAKYVNLSIEIDHLFKLDQAKHRDNQIENLLIIEKLFSELIKIN